jgi:hypothetical protein
MSEREMERSRVVSDRERMASGRACQVTGCALAGWTGRGWRMWMSARALIVPHSASETALTVVG